MVPLIEAASTRSVCIGVLLALLILLILMGPPDDTGRFG